MKHLKKIFESHELDPTKASEIASINQDLLDECEVIRDFIEDIEETFSVDVKCNIDCSSRFFNFEAFYSSFRKLISESPSHIFPTIQYNISFDLEVANEVNLIEKSLSLEERLKSISDCYISQLSIKNDSTYRREKVGGMVKLKKGQDYKNSYLTTKLNKISVQMCIIDKKTRYNPNWIK